jgi:hypothetical protein
MSYDVYLELDDKTGFDTQYVWERNHTSNTAGMWRAAGCDIAAFDGKRATELGPAAARAIAAIVTEPEKYRPMEPRNGWGSLPSTVHFLIAIWEACTDWPEATVRISR